MFKRRWKASKRKWDLFVSKAHDTIPDIPCLAEINEEIRKRGGV